AGRGAWSAALHDRAVACLARRRAALAGTVEALPMAPDEQALVDRLPAPETCGDAAYLTAGVAPPDPLQASEANELDTIVSRARNEIVTARVDDARQALDAVQNRIDALGYAPLAARARFVRALGLHTVGDLGAAFNELRETYFAARAAGDFETAAEAASDAALVLLDLSRDPEASDWARIATAEATAAAVSGSVRVALRATVAVDKQRGELGKALEAADRLVAMEKADTRTGVLAMALNERGRVLSAMGEEQRAIADFDGAIAEFHARHGEFSQPLAGAYGDRSISHSHLHRYAEAEADAREALRIAERVDGKNGEMRGVALSALGVALQGQSKLDEALATLDRSLALARATEGSDYNVASDLNNRADLLARMGRLDDAIASWEECIELWTKVLGPNGQEVAIAWINVANALISVRDEEHAEEPAHKALAILAAIGKDAPAFLVAEGKIEVGVVLVKKADWKGAREALEAGLALMDPKTGDPIWRARAEKGLGTVELRTGDAAKGRELLQSARAVYVSSPENTDVIGEIDALLSDRSHMP
ncbi:MAG TPA: tetratricopeptide repeat protein, partial [Byssovorax sp.]